MIQQLAEVLLNLITYDKDKEISVSSGGSELGHHQQYKILNQKTRSKIQNLLIEVDSRIQQAEKHNAEARDLLGQVSHLVDGADAAELCKPGNGPTPLNAREKGRRDDC
jgi:hypothetical protein